MGLERLLKPTKDKAEGLPARRFAQEPSWWPVPLLAVV